MCFANSDRLNEMETALDDLVAKQAIQEALARYCRGIDRCDIRPLQSAFWPEAMVNYGSRDENAWAWCEQVVSALKAMERTQHAIGNILIELTGETASAETYCRAYHEVAGDGGPREMMVGGRYLDRFERRDGEWRIMRRRYVMDFNQNAPSTAIWDAGLYSGLRVTGRRYPDDPLYD